MNGAYDAKLAMRDLFVEKNARCVLLDASGERPVLRAAIHVPRKVRPTVLHAELHGQTMLAVGWKSAALSTIVPIHAPAESTCAACLCGGKRYALPPYGTSILSFLRRREFISLSMKQAHSRLHDRPYFQSPLCRNDKPSSARLCSHGLAR
jgi:hypothetical protein